MPDIVEEINYLHEVTQRILEIKPLDTLLNDIMESCKQILNAEASSLLLYNETDNELYFQVATGNKGKSVKQVTLSLGTGIAGWVAENRKPLLIEDCYNDSRFNNEIDKKSSFRTKSMICVPMVYKEKLIGVVQVINKIKGELFNNRDLTVFQILASQCAIAIVNTRLIDIQISQEALRRELKMAREIQQNLLPYEIPKFEDIDVKVELIPAKQVGGDYYNVYKVDDTHTLFFICDVSGKSISAALIVSTICSCILTYFKLNHKNFNLIDLVKSLNRVLIESTTEEKFATCWFGLFDHSTKVLHSINAGHNPIFVFRDTNNPVTELNKGGLFLGSIDVDFEVENIQLQPLDVLLLYTDGIPEATNENGEFFGNDKLIKSVQKNLKLSAKIALSRLLEDLKNFVKDAEQSDDITCGIIKVL